MRRFLHHERQQLEAHLAQCRRFGADYRARSFDLDDRLELWLAEVEDFFAQLAGGGSQASAVSELRNQLECARRSVDPQTRERINTGRRALVATTCFTTLGACRDLLGSAYSSVNETLSEAGQLLEPTLLSALHAGFVTETDLTAAKASPEGSAALWGKLCSHPDLLQVCRRILLKLSPQDAHLLVFELVAKL